MIIEICKKIPNLGSDLPQIVRLWDMITFHLQPICSQFCLLQYYRDWLEEFINKHPDNKDMPVGNDNVVNFTKAISIQKYLENLGLIASPKLINQILKRLPEMSFVRVHESIINIQQMIINEIKDVLLLFIPKNKSIWLEKENNINSQLIKSFPSAKDDYNEAVLCYVYGQHTAAVFHSMRILEYGLKALAKDLKLKFYRQNWGKIIQKIKDEINNEIKTLSNQPKDPSRTERLKFLSNAAQEFTYFKDGWRNYVMHGDDKYDESQALSVFNHVKAFMVHLSKCLSE